MSIKTKNPTFFFNKKIFNINDSSDFLNNYKDIVEIPVYPHPGSFAFKRQHHIHEGIDFYCMENEPVFSILDGTILNIKEFTGEKAGSPWWNDTKMCLIDYNDFVINYGEINILPNIKEGMKIQKGQKIGNVVRVLKTDKGRPRDMLHLEMYVPDTKSPVNNWQINMPKDDKLLDPTPYFMKHFF